MANAEKGWAIVTGASAGIGADFARALARRGHPVLAVARRAERLEALAKEVDADRKTFPGRIVPVVADLETAEGVERVLEAARRRDIDLLVNNAGFGSYGRVLDLPVDRELGAIRLNVEALVHLTHRLLPQMVARGQGGVINVASVVAFQPVPFFTTYAATKAFVLSYSEGLAHELRGTGVRVHAVCPGPVRTEFEHVAGTGNVQGKLPNLEAKDVVSTALAAYEGGRVVKIAGWLNRVLAFFPRLMPRAWIRAIMGSMFRPPAESKALPAAPLG